MHRRSFLALSAIATALPSALMARGLRYQRGLVEEALANGETVFLEFGTDWCTTCASQRRTIARLKEENPAYEDAITFIDVDFDRWGNSPVATRLGVTRRSTLVVLRGEEELGRIIAGTRREQIKGLMDTALVAATS